MTEYEYHLRGKGVNTMSDSLIETFEHAGLTCEIHADWDAGDPFQEMDQAAELVGFRGFARDFNVSETLDEDSFSSVAHAARYLTLFGGYLVAIPFRFTDYGSGGYRASLTETGDDRAAGFVCVSPKGIETTGAPDAEQAARQDFETWRSWVEGETTGYVVKDPETGEVLDSCWGFYGGAEYAREEAREYADFEARERALEEEPVDVPEVLAR